MRKWIDICESTDGDFEAWFRGSKVVDENGDPLICYHGTFSNIDEFFVGTHFGDQIAAQTRIDHRHRDKDYPLFSKHHDGKVYPVYLSIKNPLRVEDNHGMRNGYDYAFEVKRLGLINDATYREVTDTGSPGVARHRLFRILTRMGYDGFVYRNVVEGDADSWVIFEKDQARHA